MRIDTNQDQYARQMQQMGGAEAAQQAGRIQPTQQPDETQASQPVQTDTAEISGFEAQRAQQQAAMQRSFDLQTRVSMHQTADQGLEQIQSNLSEMQQLAAQTPQDAAQATEMDGQYQQLLAGIDEAVQNTTYGGEPLLSGNDAQLRLNDMSTQALGLADSRLGAPDVSDNISRAIDTVQAERTDNTVRMDYASEQATERRMDENLERQANRIESAEDARIKARSLLDNLMQRRDDNAGVVHRGNAPASVLQTLL